MLQIVDICKEYKTGELVQKALDHVSLNLRENEFVAILGPSGSGKTTLLNIIGGLDRYDSGDLIINGISTKKYTDRDWDSYRNHTIGFVFQSYNLIPHQTILSNVELALTISGISKAERKEKALEALDHVGLKEQAHKKPNQLSGGQMQRVAIARALVNNPDILLADEPTGALDSETSVQVMDLLKEVAKDRLVVMVTHNPELAEEYATRIVSLRDGQIRADSDPFIVDEDSPAIHQNMGKSSMSFLTSLSLSFNNLKTKLARTLLVAFAGSIGIIGIGLISSLSNGAQDYIDSVEEETLSEYPVQIMTTSFDLSTMMNQTNEEYEDTDVIKERQMVSNMFSRLTSNDLPTLKEHLDENYHEINTYAKAIEYSYSTTPQIFRITDNDYRQVNPDKSFARLGISSDNSNSMMSLAMSTDVFYALPKNDNLYKPQYDVKAGRWPENNRECVVVLFSDGSISDFVLYALGLKDTDELDEMVKKFANEEDINLKTEPGYYKYEDLLGVSFRLINQVDYYKYDAEYKTWVDQSENKKFMNDLLRKAEEIKVVGVIQRKEDVDVAMLTNGIAYPNGLLEQVMVNAQNSEITKQQLNDPDVNVFTGKPFDDPENDFDMEKMFEIDEEEIQNAFKFDASNMSIDSSAFNMNIDLSNLNMDKLADNMTPSFDLAKIFSQLDVKLKTDKSQEIIETMLKEYLEQASKDPATDYAHLSESFQKYLQSEEGRNLLLKEIQEIIDTVAPKDITTEEIQQIVTYVLEDYPAFFVDGGYSEDQQAEALSAYLQSEKAQQRINDSLGQFIANHEIGTVTNEQLESIIQAIGEGYTSYAQANGLPDPSKAQESIQKYFDSETGKKTVSSAVMKVIDLDDISKQLNSILAKEMGGYSKEMEKAMKSIMADVTKQLTSQLTNGMNKAMGQMASKLQNAISIDPDAFSRAFKMNYEPEELQDLMMSMMTSQYETYDNNLRKLGYGILSKPTQIDIYPLDFEAKEHVTRILNEYNSEQEDAGEDDKVIHYTDFVGTLMSSVTNIIDTISYVLIAFVAISLIVSSIMIGVITYISVLERNKEIGILRAIGASKRNISQVFNAETFIIGLLAGIIGVGITELLLIPINYLIHTLSDNPNINAYLPPQAIGLLILLSVILTIIGGLIPSRKAAKSDPVTALRTE